MKKLVFEGTEEQFKNLKELVNQTIILPLPKINENYQTDNLWSVEDVMQSYICTEEEAMEVLEQALTNEATMSQIWLAIHFHAQENELEKKKYKL